MNFPLGDLRTRAMVTLFLETGTAGHGLQIGPWESDLSVAGLCAPGHYKERVDVSDRDTGIGAIEGGDKYPEWSVTILHKGKLSDAAAETIADCVLYRNKFAADAYTDPLGKVPSHKATITFTAPGDGVDAFETRNCFITMDYSTGEKNTLALKATCKRPLASGDPADLNNDPLIWV